MTIERTAIIDLDNLKALDNAEIVRNALNYFNRVDDHVQIKEAIKQRFGMGIQQKKDPANKSAIMETYVRQGFNIEVDSGMVEAIGIGFGNKVAQALANMHTEPGQRFVIAGETDNSDVKKGEELLQENRDKGGYERALTLADTMSIEVGCALHYASWSNGSNDYQVIPPSDIRVYYSNVVVEDGRERAVDTTNLEDASVVIMRLNQIDLDKWNYLAIYGACDIYPQGRYVMFEGSELDTKIPEVGSPEANDWIPSTGGVVENGGNVANPLTWYGLQNPEMDVPEYPLSIIKGATDNNTDLLPLSFSLYNDSIEFDIGASHVLACVNDAARGLTIVEVDATGATQPLPRTLTGAVVSNPGQSISHVSLESNDAKIAWETMRDEQVAAAAGYAVPDYMVSSEDHTVDASSGVALEIKSRPLKKQRDKRISINEPAINRLFKIEKALIALYSDADETAIKQLETSEQRWEPGELKLPENKLEEANRIKVLSELGILDEIGKIREYYKLSSDQEAIEVYEKMKDRAGQYPALNAAPEPVKTAGRGFKPRALNNA